MLNLAEALIKTEKHNLVNCAKEILQLIVTEYPENREIIIPLKDLTEKSLSDIICSFIDEYKSCIEPQGEKNERSRSK